MSDQEPIPTFAEIWDTGYKLYKEQLDAKNAAYREWDMLMAALSKIWPSHAAIHQGEWEDDWRTIICIHSPMGQLSWHIYDSEISLFKHLIVEPVDWDQHTTDEKYARLATLRPVNLQ